MDSRFEAFFAGLETAGVCVDASPATTLRVPRFKASIWRSAWIDRLREQACSERSREVCTGCPRVAECVYPILAETRALCTSPAAPPALVVRPPLLRDEQISAGEALRFGATVIGPRGAAAVASAAEQMVIIGVDGEVVPLRPIEIRTVRRSLRPRAEVLAAAGAVEVRFYTPFRTKQDGRFGQPITARGFLQAVHRRLRVLGGSDDDGRELLPHFDEMGPLPQLGDVRVRWQDWSRRSRREEATMTLGGHVGRFHLRGEFDRWGPLLALAERVHVGKSTAFGLGWIGVRPD